MEKCSNDCIGRKEHEEFVRRMEAEHLLLNKTIDAIQREVKETSKIVNAVNTMAVNMEMMLKEQQEQGERLEKLEARDGEKWRSFVEKVVVAVVGAVIGYIAKQLGM